MLKSQKKKTTVTTIKHGCLSELARYALVVLGYYLILNFILFIPADFSWGFALVLSIFGYFLLNGLILKFTVTPAMQAIARAEKGQPLQDGQIVAIDGPLVALAAPLRSPLQRKHCCAYEYKIFRPTLDGEGNPTAYKDFRGFAYAPCAIQTSHGEITLMGLSFSALDDFEQVSLSAKKTHPIAERYIKETEFNAEPLTSLTTLGEELRSLFDNPTPTERWDYCQNDAKLTREHTYAETVLTAGQMVTVIGFYSAEKRALLTKGTAILRIMPGDVASSRERLHKSSTGTLLFAVVLFAVSHGMFIVLFLNDALK